MESDQRTRLEILEQPESLRKTIYQEQANIERIARKIVNGNYQRIYAVGMGSSYSAALMGESFFRGISTMPFEVFRGYEIEFEQPRGLGKDACVVSISFSGETEDVVSALKFAKGRGAYTISISGPEDNTIAREADDALRIISSDTKAMVAAHLSQVALLYLLLGSVAKYRDQSKRIDEVQHQLNELVGKLQTVIAEQEEKCMKLADQYKNESIFYVISAGPAYGVAYKLAMTELTENVWVHGIVQYSTEFRHGIVEKMEPGLPVIFLIGNDPSHVDLRRELETCHKIGTKTIVWDANDFPRTDPFLAPFYLSVPASWFVYYLALARGRLASERRYMGSVIPYANMKSLAK